MKSLVLSLAIALTSLAQAQMTDRALDGQTKLRLQQEIQYIGNLFENFYAPKAWKEQHLKWDLKAQQTLAETRVAAAQTLREARSAIADFIKSTADYHVGFSFYSTERASLPFQVKTVEGKTIIVHIDRSKLSEAAFPFAVGDELLTLGDTPVAQVLQEIQEQNGANVPETDKALADIYLTRRSGRLNASVPRGPVTLSVKRASDESVGTVQLAWDYSPEQLEQASVPLSLKRPVSMIANKKMISPWAHELSEEAAAEENRHSIGVRQSFLTDFGDRIWSTDDANTFDAYIFRSETGQMIGVVRVFGYIVSDYTKAMKDFEAIIQKMQTHTEALIIDQINNPGGSVFYLYGLASMLTDQVLAVPKHKISLTHDEAKECVQFNEAMSKVKNEEEALKLIGETQGYPGTYQLAVSIKDFCANVIREFRTGQKLSSSLYLWGVDKINPHPKARFTKPLVILTNELDFSGGDFFPAILQDNKRATIVGTRTAGAGGYVVEANFPNTFGLEFLSFTGSIAQRLGQNPIENLGVTPDVPLAMTLDDYRKGFEGYKKGVINVIQGLLAAKP
jgi:hypothetical protein